MNTQHNALGRLCQTPQSSRHQLLHTQLQTTPEQRRQESKEPLTNEQQLERIASRVNSTIEDLNVIYKEIGYTHNEILDKKSAIFQAIQDTISMFTQNLQREKSNIENECDWLRQQIRIILAMLNDNTGVRTLDTSSRGIVFEDTALYEEGIKEDVLQQIKRIERPAFGVLLPPFTTRNGKQPTSSFHLESPFNDSNFTTMNTDNLVSLGSPSDELSVLQQYNYMLSHQQKPSLLQLKSRLNAIFLDVLKAFVKIFRKFNKLNCLFWENIESVFESWTPTSALLRSIPTKAEAEDHGLLIEEFDAVLKALNLSHKSVQPEILAGPKASATNEYSFVILSPSKSLRKQSIELSDDSASQTPEAVEHMDRLRQVNYKIVRAIRALKITKITNDTLAALEQELEKSEAEVLKRVETMSEAINECLGLVDALSLTTLDIITIQKMQDRSDGDKQNAEHYLDIDTLRFIERNPRELGIKDHHLQFITRLASTLQVIKDTKQRKWEYYSNACIKLWDKLGESQEFTEQYLQANSTLTDTSLNNLKMEFNRLLIKRSEFVDTFIKDAKDQIRAMQQSLLYSENQCKNFDEKVREHFDDDEDEEDKEKYLNFLEAEIEALKEEYNKKKPVLELYAELNELVKNQSFLIQSSKDSSRLLSKNSCKILLNEEKIRKKINKNMPRCLDALKKEIKKYNNEQLSLGNRPITIGDQDLFERVLVVESEYAATSKNGRTRTVNTAKSVSPTKSRATHRLASPAKQISPKRVTKHPTTTKRTVSPSYPHLRDKQAPVRQSHGTPVNMISEQLLQASHHFNKGPSAIERFAGTRLQPLNSPLSQSIIYDDHVDRSGDESNQSTLYSICTRVSPLRDLQDNRPSRTSFSPIKPAVVANENKENPDSPTRPHADISRLSTNSLASSMAGDDYQSWRDERIREFHRRGA